MTLRGVIQGLVNGSGDAEAALAENGYGDLPAEMFGQALSSYADTASMAEADALSPILTAIDAGDASDVFALMEEHPPTLDPTAGDDLSGLGLAGVAGIDAFDGLDAHDLDAHDLDAHDLDADDPDLAVDEDGGFGESTAELDDQLALDDEAEIDEQPEPLAADEMSTAALDGFDDDVIDSASEFESLEALFDTAPEATDDDPDDLDL